MNRHVARIFIIAMLIAVTHGWAINNSFVWDDLPVIVKNPLFNGKGGIIDVLMAEDTIKAEIGRPTGYYRPLTYLSFYVDQAVWGMNPTGFHLTSLLLHAGVACCLYVLLAAIPATAAFSLPGTLLFALNPVTVETVCFISGGRNTLLCALFIMLALIFHRQGKCPVTLLCLLAASASKETGLLAPFILVIHDRLVEKHSVTIRHYSVYLLPAVLFLALKKLVITHQTIPPFTILLNIMLQAMSNTPELVSRYIAIILVPGMQKVGYSLTTSAISKAAYFLLLLLIILLVLMIWRKGSKVSAFGCCWFLLFLAPVLIPGAYYTLSMADRHAYIPGLGIAIAVTASMNSWTVKYRTVVLAIIISVFAFFSFTGSAVWRSNKMFFLKMIEDVPHLQIGYTGLADNYFREGSIAEGERWLDKGVKASALPENKARDMLVSMLCTEGERLLQAGNLDEAEKLFGRVLRLKHDFVPALIDMGGVNARRGNSEAAIRYFSRAIELQPENPIPHFNLSEIYRMRHDMPAAEKASREYRRLAGEK